jgi:hypothetical protein
MKCSICGISESDTPKFYYNSSFGKNLCNKHYIQLRRNGFITDNKSLNSLNCDIRGNNSSGVTGISYVKKINSWRAYINWEGKRIELGYRKNIDNAIKLRLLKEYELLGELSPQKHLFEKYSIIGGIISEK